MFSKQESDSSDTNDDSLLNESSSQEDTDSELEGINGLLDGHFKETEANESEYLGFHNLAFKQEDGEDAVLESVKKKRTQIRQTVHCYRKKSTMQYPSFGCNHDKQNIS